MRGGHIDGFEHCYHADALTLIRDGWKPETVCRAYGIRLPTLKEWLRWARAREWIEVDKRARRRAGDNRQH